METPKCTKCGGDMEEGLVLDQDGTVYSCAGWVPGKPEDGWFGTKAIGRNHHDIRMFCCRDCGYLESYVLRETVAAVK